MTMSQHLGETLHGFVYRLLGSLGGALFGYIVWEISSKNQYGSAVIVSTLGKLDTVLRRNNKRPYRTGYVRFHRRSLLVSYTTISSLLS